MNWKGINDFISYGMWEKKPRPRWERCGVFLLRRVYLTGLLFWKKGHIDYATILSFNTLMAIVPIFALIFAIGNGFGFDVYIEKWALDVFSSQPQAAHAIVNFARSYIANTHTGIFIGVGLLFMLYTVISLIYNVENVFDAIWQVERRSFTAMLTNYVGMIFLVPIAVIVVSGLNIFVYGRLDWLQEIEMFRPVVFLLLNRVGPWLLMSVIFAGVFFVMPNTRVQFDKIIIPALIASLGILILQYAYVNLQVLFTTYNAVYGSFAALPLFLIWLQLCWYIILVCAELCYINQNVQMYEYLIDTQHISHNKLMIISGILFSMLCRCQHEMQTPFTAKQLIERSGFPSRVVVDVLQLLTRVGLVIESHAKNDERVSYIPNGDSTDMTLGKLTEMVEAYPADAADKLTLTMEQNMNDDVRKQISAIYDNYLQALDQIGVNALTV